VAGIQNELSDYLLFVLVLCSQFVVAVAVMLLK